MVSQKAYRIWSLVGFDRELQMADLKTKQAWFSLAISALLPGRQSRALIQGCELFLVALARLES
jgi:hypothetical protein